MDSWTQLVARLNEKLRYEILQISADRNASLSDASAVTIPGATPVACSDDIETLVHTVAAADLLIGIDSGPIHIAAAVNTPFVSLFGPVNPALRLSKGNLPEALVHQLDCSFCHHRRPRGHWRTGCPKDIACMVEISVGRVFEKSVELLARGR
jgi:heptosyltransferase-1